MGLPVFWQKEKTPRNHGVSHNTIFQDASPGSRTPIERTEISRAIHYTKDA